MQNPGNDVPVMLERDFNIPELEEIQKVMNMLREIKYEILVRFIEKAINT